MSLPDQVRSLFEIAAEMPTEEREALLRLYRHDPQLVAEVRQLLAALGAKTEPAAAAKAEALKPETPATRRDPDFDQALARILGGDEATKAEVKAKSTDAVEQVRTELAQAKKEITAEDVKEPLPLILEPEKLAAAAAAAAAAAGLGAIASGVTGTAAGASPEPSREVGAGAEDKPKPEAKPSAQAERETSAETETAEFEAPKIESPRKETPAAATTAAAPAGASAKPPQAGGVVGPYKLVKEIGRSRHSVVYQAARIDDPNKQPVAVRVALGAVAPSALRRDQSAIAALRHPSIAGLLAGGTTPEGVVYVVSEFVEGVPMFDWAQQKKLNLHQRLNLFQQAAAAVDYAHRSLVVHRNLTPNNIRVAPNGKVSICDFGLARIFTEHEIKPFAIDPAATPRYASPEQVSYQEVNTSTDIYALGVILYELITQGESPYKLNHPSFHDYIEATRHQTPRRPSSVNSAIDSDLEAIVLKAIEKDPTKRYGAVAQLREDLERYLFGASAPKRPVVAAAAAATADTDGDAPVSWTKSLRKMWFPLAAAALLALWGAFSAIAARNEASTEKELRAAAENKINDTAKELTGARAATQAADRRRAEAEQARSEAERRSEAAGGAIRATTYQLSETRNAAKNLLFQLYDVVRDPRTTPLAKQQSINKAIREIERLAQISSGDSQLKSTLAAAYMRAGDLMSQSIRSGAPVKDATDFYRRGLELNLEMAAAVNQPLLRAVASQAGVALAHSRLGDGRQAFASMNTAFGSYAEIAQAQKSGLEGRQTRAKLFDASCQITAMHGSVDEAMRICSDAARYANDLAANEEPSVRMYRGNNYASLAAQAEAKGELARALILLNASARTFAQCMVDTPEHRDCSGGIASVSSYLGAWQEKLTANESDDAYRNAISALRAIAPHSPVKDAVDRVRASVHSRYSEFLRRTGRQREAQEQAKESLAILEQKR